MTDYVFPNHPVFPRFDAIFYDEELMTPPARRINLRIPGVSTISFTAPAGVDDEEALKSFRRMWARTTYGFSRKIICIDGPPPVFPLSKSIPYALHVVNSYIFCWGEIVMNHTAYRSRAEARMEAIDQAISSYLGRPLR